MARTHNNQEDGNPVTFMDHVAKAKNRGILRWLSNNKYNKNENHIMIDFETVKTGTHKTKEKNPRDVISHDTQEPFEMGLSVRDSNGNWRHRAFLFTPPNINKNNPFYKPNAKAHHANPEAFHNAATQFHTTKMSSKGVYKRGDWKPGMAPKDSDEDEDGRYEELHEAIQPYTYETMGGKSEHEKQPIPWGKIDEWLGSLGVSKDKKTNFVAHNSSFDLPILERMINLGENGNLATNRHGDETGKTKGRSSLLGSLYNAINDTNGRNEATFRWATEKELAKAVWYNDQGKRVDMRPNRVWQGGYLSEGRYTNRDVGDGFRQDTLVEFMRLLGDTGTNNRNKLVLRKKERTGKEGATHKKGWFQSMYVANREKSYGSGAPRGNGLDDIRASFQEYAFKDGTKDNPAHKLFESIKKGMESEEEDHEFFKDLRLTKAIKKEMSNSGKYKVRSLTKAKKETYNARDYFRAFNAVAAHSGAADTAFVTTMLFPFMEDFMDVLDHKKYNPINAAGEFVEGQGQVFSDAFMKFHNKWGQMLGTYPPKSSDETADPVLSNKTFKNPVLRGIVKNLNNKNAWFNDDGTRRINEDGSDLNPLLHEGSSIITPRQTTLDSDAQQAEQEREQSIFKAEWDKFRVGKKEEGKTEDETKAEFKEYWEENRDELLGTPKPSKSEAGEPDLSGQNDPVTQQTISEGLRPKASDFKGFEDRITGPITVRKWQGYDGRGERIVVSIPIDNTRVTFSESEWDGFTYKPLLGAARVAETPEGKGAEVGVRDYSTHLFADYRNPATGEEFPAPEGALGAEIERVLREYHGKLQQYVEPHSVLGHRALNEWINTPASSWLSQSLSLSPFQREDIRNYGMENVGNDPTGFQTNRKFVGWAHQVLEDAKANPDDPLKQAQKALLFNAPHLATKFTEFQENHDPVNVLQGVLEKHNLAPDFFALGTGDDPNLFSQDENGKTTVNMDYLYNTFFSGQQIQDRDGNVIEGLHPQQFFFRTGQSLRGPYGMNLRDQDVDLQAAFANYVECAIRVGVARNSIPDSLRYMDYAHLPLHDLNDPPSRRQLEDNATDPALSQEERTANANELGKDNEPIAAEIEDQVSPEVKEEREHRSTFEDAREEAESQEDFSNRINKIIEDLKLNGSSFVTDNYINSIEGEASVDAAYNALFPPRETAQTPEEIQDLLFDALDQYAGSDKYRTDSSTPDATTFARELEWIRINHLDTFSQEKLTEALNSNDLQSLAGQWLDLFNYAGTAMGEFAGDGLALVEEEKAQMGDRFMGNAHRQFLHHSYDPDDPQNWDEDSVQEKTKLIQDHFATDPKMEDRRSWRDRAKAMAIGTAKAPIEALKWYTSWNDLSQQVKDTVSGRAAIGRKLVAAAREGTDPYSVNIGTTAEPKRVGSVEELNYYTENVPLSREQQPSLIRQFLVGRTTYGDALTESQKPSKQDNVRSFVNKVNEFQEGAVRLRTVPATTPEQTEFGAEQYENVSGQQANYENRIKNVATEIRDRDPEQGIFLPKSLDKLRDYLLRV